MTEEQFEINAVLANEGEDAPPPRGRWVVKPMTLMLDGPPEAQAKLFAAIAQAQAQYAVASKNATGRIGQGGAQTFKYADLEEIISAVRPALSAAGVAILQPFHATLDGGTLSTILAGHGAMLRADVRTPGHAFDSQSVKNLGAYLTYMRRYALQSIVGIAGDADADEGDDMLPQRGRQQPPSPPKQEPRQQPQAAPKREPPKEPPKAAPQEKPAPKPAPAPAKPKTEPPPPPEPEPEEVETEGVELEPEPEEADPVLLGPALEQSRARIKELGKECFSNMGQAIEWFNNYSTETFGHPCLVRPNPTAKPQWNALFTEGNARDLIAELEKPRD